MPKPKPPLFTTWTTVQETVLKLAFEGRWSAREMSEKVGVVSRTVERWLAHPAFQQRLADLRSDFAASLKDVAYADKAQRVVGFSQMAESARREYEARPWLKEVRPGPFGDTTNESFNAAAHAAFCKGLAEIAAELGERKNVTELTASVKVAHGIDTDDPESAALARALIQRVSSGGPTDASGPSIPGKQ